MTTVSNNPEVFYLVGALKDGCLSTEWTVVYVQKCKEWLTSTIIPMINKIFGIDLSDNKLIWQDGAWRIKFKNKCIWNELKRLTGIIPQNKESQKFYLMGFWDAEGGCPRSPTKNKAIYLDFTQKDKQSLEEIRKICNKTFGIRTGRVRLSDKKKNIWRICIENQDGMIKFCELIGSLHPEKRLRLEKIKKLLN